MNNNLEVMKMKEKATNYMSNKLGHIFKNYASAEFTFGNGKVATVTRTYIGHSNHSYKLEFEGDVLCETTNPYSCGWILYVLGCEEGGLAWMN